MTMQEDRKEILMVFDEYKLFEVVYTAIEEVLSRREKRMAGRAMNVRQAAEVLGVSVSTLRTLKRKGLIRHTPIAGRVMFTQEQLDEFLTKQGDSLA